MYVTLATNPPLFPLEPEGVEVNFGNDATGLGDVEPAPTTNPGETPVVDETQQQPTITQTSSPAEVDAPADIQENVITQNHEDAIAIAEKKKAAIELKHAQAEQKKVEDEQKRIADEQQRKINEINARAGHAFGHGTGTGSQGIKEGNGNMGNPNGVANSTNYIGTGGD